jgi:hypothetical protein
MPAGGPPIDTVKGLDYTQGGLYLARVEFPVVRPRPEPEAALAATSVGTREAGT